MKAFKANPTPETLAKVQSEYDKAVKKDLLKKNTASRRKAKLYKIAKNAGLKLEKTAKKAEVKEKKAVAKKTAPKAKTAKK